MNGVRVSSVTAGTPATGFEARRSKNGPRDTLEKYEKKGPKGWRGRRNGLGGR